MWKYFWDYWTDMPQGMGVVQFGTVHLSWVFVSLALIFLIALLYKKQSVVIRRRIELTIATALIADYLVRWTWAGLIGHYYPAEMLPLHLCSLSVIIDIIAIFTKKTLLKEFGYACGLPGGLVTFLIPGMGPYPLWHFYYLLFVFSHMALIMLPVLWVWGDGFRPEFKRLRICIVILLVMAGVDVIINKLIDSNFMFLNYIPEDTILTAVANKLGSPFYQLAMGGIFIVVWALLYVPWLISKNIVKIE